jgi:putative component of membrane protein insertase Oxa1/YidC/SpoIIIJ protein YidD
MPNILFKFPFVILFVLVCALPLEAQTKLSHWEAVPTHYTTIDTAIKTSTPAQWSMANLIVVPYRIFFSSVDGMHCPFTPSCSAFFVDACRQTNFIQGTLMFVDRFTRDSNTFDRTLHYPYNADHRLVDPACNYRLYDSLIVVNPEK